LFEFSHLKVVVTVWWSPDIGVHAYTFFRGWSGGNLWAGDALCLECKLLQTLPGCW